MPRGSRGRTVWSVALALGLGTLGASHGRGAETLPPTTTPAPAQAAPASDPDLAARVQRLEAQNQELLERDRRREARYRELESRYERVLERLDRVETAPAPAPAPGPNLPAAAAPAPSPPAPAPSPATEPLFGRSARPEVDRELIPESSRAFPDFAPGKGPALRGRLEEGFEIVSADEEYSLRFRALNQTDFKVFSPNNLNPTTSGIYFPRTRFYFEGDLTRNFQYELSIQRSVEGQFDILDAYVNARINEGLQIKFGRAIVPYSYDWYDHLEPYFIAPERGLFPLNYGLSRQGGLMVWGVLRDGAVEYALGGFDGRLIGLADNNNTRDAVGYLNVRPFLNREGRSRLRFLNLGGSIAGGQTNRLSPMLPLRTSLQSSENDEAARSASISFFDFNDDIRGYGDRFQGALHLAYYGGGLSVEAEVQAGEFGASRVGFDEAGNVVRYSPTMYYPVLGYHVGAGYFLTGEQVEGRGTVVPLRPFDMYHHQWGPGAFEVFGRFSRLALGSQVFEQNLANPADWSREAAITDIGVNWYLNRFLKVYVDWQHAMFDTPVLVNEITGQHSRSNDLFWIRMQVWF